MSQIKHGSKRPLHDSRNTRPPLPGREVMEEMDSALAKLERELWLRRQEDWSFLAHQVVGGEVNPEKISNTKPKKSLPPARDLIDIIEHPSEEAEELFQKMLRWLKEGLPPATSPGFWMQLIR